MSTIDLIGLLVPATFFVLLGLERLAPARSFPARRGWTWIGIGFFFVGGALATGVPLAIDPAWLAAHRWIDATGLGVAGGTVAGWLALSLLAFVWHRLQHAVPVLWRLGHQLHHSPQRVDMAGAFFFHPLEVIVQALFQVFATTIVFGLDPLAAALTGYVAVFHAMFQHLNLRTPRWLGYVIQRPESHCEHHRRGVHAGNYADFPLWDLLFGSFLNPAEFRGDCGFDSPADRKVAAMLGFADVNAALYGSASRGAKPGVIDSSA